MERTIEVPQAPGEPAPVGVLLVHGIGRQERGDTLLGFGEPLYRWMNAWVNKDPYPDHNGDNNVRLDDTSLLRPPRAALDAPPSMLMHLTWNDGGQVAEERSPGTPPDHAASFLVAESWWAKDFREPRFRQLFGWGVAYAPWVLHRYAARRWEHAGRDCRGLAPGRSVGAWREAAFSVLVATTVTVLAPVVAVLFQIAMLALLLLAMVPALRGWVAGLQARLAGAAGDAYLLATSPVRFDAMVSQVQRDLNWLAWGDQNAPDRDGGDQDGDGQGGDGRRLQCGRIAVLAHSQGSVIAHQALREFGEARTKNPRHPIPPVRHFVTFGNAFEQLAMARRALPHQDHLWRRAVVCYLGLALGVVALAWTWLDLGDVPGLARWLLGGAGAALVLGAHAWRMPPIDGLRDKDLDLPAYGAEEGWTWRDYYASADPVSDGALKWPPPYDEGAAERSRAAESPPWFHSKRIRNRDSILADHTSYWQNAEQFVAPVARALVGLADPAFPGPGDDGAFLVVPGDKVLLAQAGRRRRPRVDALRVAGWLAFAAVPLALAGLWGEPLARLARWGAGVAGPVLGWLADLLGVGGLTDGARASWVGAAMVAAAAWAYRAAVIAPLWRRWDLCLAAQFVERTWRGWRTSRLGLFAAAATVPLPAAAGVAAYGWVAPPARWPVAVAVAAAAALVCLWALAVRPVRAAARTDVPSGAAAPAPPGWTGEAARAEP